MDPRERGLAQQGAAWPWWVGLTSNWEGSNRWPPRSIGPLSDPQLRDTGCQVIKKYANGRAYAHAKANLAKGFPSDNNSPQRLPATCRCRLARAQECFQSVRNALTLFVGALPSPPETKTRTGTHFHKQTHSSRGSRTPGPLAPLGGDRKGAPRFY